MKKTDFIKLHMNLTITLPKVCEKNYVLSATDPTQDIPVKMIQMAATGVPINVKQYKSMMSGVKIENFSSIERRNMDAFDCLGELQNAAKAVSKSGATTNYVKPKKNKKNEN